MNNISENIQYLNDMKHRIAASIGDCEKSILLVAVTKTRSVAEINAAIDAGITDIGENKVQEIIDKYEEIKPVNWHMIGHLQTNKVKYIIDKVSLIHSVDSLKLAEEIDKRASQNSIMMDILIQINAAKEESKFGISESETESLIKDILASCQNVRIKGLMTIAPFDEEPENIRQYFGQVRTLYERLKMIKHDKLDFQYLSMGMSNDYKVAIEEGSNLIRVGTAIFGERQYNKL